MAPERSVGILALDGGEDVKFGLTMRYLGLSLRMVVAPGVTAAFGTLGPVLFRGRLLELATSFSDRITFSGIAIALLGIAVIALAGRAKERELGDAARGLRVWAGIALPVLSTVVIGAGNYFAVRAAS
jgi:L-rhamnose-H+ transport protein